MLIFFIRLVNLVWFGVTAFAVVCELDSMGLILFVELCFVFGFHSAIRLFALLWVFACLTLGWLVFVSFVF